MSAADVLAILWRASWIGALAAALTGLVTLLLRRRVPPSLRAWLWWLAAAQFVVALAPRWAVTLGAPAPAMPAALAWVAAPAREAGALAATVTAPIAAPIASPADPWSLVPTLLVAIWILGALAMAARHLRARREIERAWRAAEPFEASPAETGLLREHRSKTGVTPEVCVTRAFDVPLTLGGARPRILLPAHVLELDEESRLLVLAHECAHVARRDLVFGWLPAAVEAAFWFHPLARLAVAEYGQAREESCDARALVEVRTSPRAYGELLLRFGVAPRSIPSTASCGSSSRRALLRRLHMLGHSSAFSRSGRFAGLGLVALAALTLVPLRLEAEHSRHAQRTARSVKHERWTKPAKPARPAHLTTEHFAYLLVAADGQRTSGMMNSGSDHDDARAATREYRQQVWWFRLDDDRWVVLDRAFQARVQEVYDAMDREHERRMAEFEEPIRALEQRVDRLERQVERLEGEREKLMSARERLREDPDGDGDDPRLAELARSLEDLHAQRERVYEQREELYRERESIFRERETAVVELERKQLEYDQRFHDLARAAVEAGIARPFRD